jgi:hypothetical protein
MNQGKYESPLLSNFALEYAIRKQREIATEWDTSSSGLS